MSDSFFAKAAFALWSKEVKSTLPEVWFSGGGGDAGADACFYLLFDLLIYWFIVWFIDVLIVWFIVLLIDWFIDSLIYVRFRA